MNIIVKLSPILLLAVTGCVSVNPRASLPEVQRTIAERTAYQITWYTGGAEDREAADKVRELLSKPLNPDAAVQVALLNNRHLQATYEELGIAQADLVQAGLLKNPIFDGALRFAEGGAGSPTIDLGIAIEFLDVLFVGLRKEQAQAQLEATKARVTSAVLQTAADTKKAFFDFQAAEQSLELQKQVYQATEASYELAKRIRAAGNNTTLELANERALYEEARLAVASAEASIIERREALIRQLGLWGSQTAIKVQGRLADPPQELTFNQELERQVIDRSLTLDAARAEYVSSLKAAGIASPLGVLSESEVGISAERGEGEWELGPSLSLPIPIFGQGQPAIARAGSRVRQAAHNYYAAAIDIRSALRQAYAKAISLQQRIQHYQKVMLPLRQSIVEDSQLQYNAMQIGAFQLLQAKRDQIQAGLSYLELLRDYWKARADLELILNGGSASLSPSETSASSVTSRASRGH